jgi:hypothetical protein
LRQHHHWLLTALVVELWLTFAATLLIQLQQQQQQQQQQQHRHQQGTLVLGGLHLRICGMLGHCRSLLPQLCLLSRQMRRKKVDSRKGQRR